MAPQKQLKISTNKMVCGVLGGFAEYMDIDVTLLRVLYAAFLVLTGVFPGVVMYFIACIIMNSNK
ncbi:MAG: PspC domain-containing protein [Candidatus Kerfeldbacteria bacterium]